jgi:hypothetical protein
MNNLILKMDFKTQSKIKKDFEAITQFEDTSYVFGSGSTENRHTMDHDDAKTKKVRRVTKTQVTGTPHEISHPTVKVRHPKRNSQEKN